MRFERGWHRRIDGAEYDAGDVNAKAAAEGQNRRQVCCQIRERGAAHKGRPQNVRYLRPSSPLVTFTQPISTLAPCYMVRGFGLQK